MTATGHLHMHIVMMDKESKNALPAKVGWEVTTRRGELDISDVRHLLVLVAASQLASVSRLVKEAVKRHKLSGLLIRRDLPSDSWLFSQFYSSGLRSFRNVVIHSDPKVPGRVLFAWSVGAQKEMIAEASATPTDLFVRNCAFETFEIPVKSLVSLSRVPGEHVPQFEIGANGRFLFWPEYDIHLGIEAFRSVGDPGYRETVAVERLRRLERLGDAIQRLRITNGVARRSVSGLSERQLRRIEKGEHLPRAGTFRSLAKAHGMSLGDYLDALANAEPTGAV